MSKIITKSSIRKCEKKFHINICAAEGAGMEAIMKKLFTLMKDGRSAPILVEESAFKGVKTIAMKVAEDMKRVGGCMPALFPSLNEAAVNTYEGRVILFATEGKSSLLEELKTRGILNTHNIQGKREVYGIHLVNQPWEGIDSALIIIGSDKRGTIYGMFHLSELLGVSPLHYFGDVRPEQKQEVVLDEGVEMISKEPSVKYRGFFINDEWPCFGNWTLEHFDGFTAEMYDKVFELLLRLKGNYLWPAMWTSSFALDGPGLASAELADLYGVIIGNSHHEPCLRASEEWDIYRGAKSIYGNEWNYYTNKDGLLRYWEDGLKRSSKYENIITIGMRGERDSSMLGQDASLKQNIDLLKDIITEQRKLIQKNVNEDLSEVSQLLALYKEVEPYFYGDENTSGLKNWDGLDGVTLMLCEDNFGNMRSLPTEEMRGHKGGYGMYYHFDYHGGPISYEWVNSTPLSKIWEQMTMAYDYGVHEVWIVNVGDLKFNEFPLSYFMNLAYDFDNLGTTSPNQTDKFTHEWIRGQFGNRISELTVKELAEVQTGFVRINGMRRPEALNSHIYHPVHYLEADRMLMESNKIMNQAQHLYEMILKECRDSYYSMIYFPAMASMNLLQMHLYAGKNEHYARQGKPVANEYASKVTECIKRDRELAAEFGSFLEGKWNGMQLAQHIGFTKWNDDDYRYPFRMQVEPAHMPRMVVSRADQEDIFVKTYSAPMFIEVKDFLYLSNTQVDIEIANGGIGSLTYQVEMEPCEWLTYSCETNNVKCQEILKLHCNRDKLPKEEELRILMIDDRNTKVAIHVYGKEVEDQEAEPMTFFENNRTIVIEANHYQMLKNTDDSELIILNDFGRSGYGIKAYPVTNSFLVGEGPAAVYSVWMEQAGEYTLEVWMAPSNPVKHGTRMRYSVQVNEGKAQLIESVPDGFQAGVPHNTLWQTGVLNNIRKSLSRIDLIKGSNHIEIGIVDPGVVLERLVIYPDTYAPKKSYLGPMESYYKK